MISTLRRGAGREDFSRDNFNFMETAMNQHNSRAAGAAYTMALVTPA